MKTSECLGITHTGNCLVWLGNLYSSLIADVEVYLHTLSLTLGYLILFSKEVRYLFFILGIWHYNGMKLSIARKNSLWI